MWITLTDEQCQRLHELAAQRAVPVNEIIRDFIRDGLTRSEPPNRDELVRRFLASAGSGDSGCTDISERHDDYLDEAYEP
jgi:hypothetical protein